MKTRAFELTVSEQRLIVAVLLALVGIAALKSHLSDKQFAAPNEFAQPSPSPGILP